MNGLAALAFTVLSSQRASKAGSQVATTLASTNVELSGMRTTYVEIDILLAKYNFCTDLNETMIKKNGNVHMALNQKMTALNREKQEFQKKYESSAFLSLERAQQEYNRLAEIRQDLQRLSNRLQNGLMEDSNVSSLLLRDSINVLLKKYSKTRGYSLVFSNTGFNNLLYANSAYNITGEIVGGLNARYLSTKK